MAGGVFWWRGRATAELRSNKHVAKTSHNFILDSVPMKKAETISQIFNLEEGKSASE